MSKLRVAIAGAGFISSSRHLPAWRRNGKTVDLIALSDLNPEVSGRVAKHFGIARTYVDAAEMIKTERPDVIDICTPPATHAKIAEIAINYGCHLLIEKPMALTAEDCDAIVSRAYEKKVKICVGHTGLFYEPFLRARALLEQGAIGPFRGMRVVISTPTDYMTSKKDHWAHKLPGGAIGETGPHAVYMSLPFIGYVNKLSVAGLKLMPEYPWSMYEDYRITLTGEKGISTITVNYATNQWMVQVEIVGGTGTLLLDLHGRCVVKVRRERLRPSAIGLSVVGQAGQIIKEALVTSTRLVTARTASTHDRLINAFIKSLINDEPPPVTPEEGREAVRVLNMIATELEEQRRKSDDGHQQNESEPEPSHMVGTTD